MRLLITTIAASVLLSGAVHAQETTTFIGVQTTTKPAAGPVLVLPFVADRTAKQHAGKGDRFQPGPFSELRDEDKVEWRR